MLRRVFLAASSFASNSPSSFLQRNLNPAETTFPIASERNFLRSILI